MIEEFDQDVHFVEIDIEEDPEIAEAAGIMGTPCVQFFKNKEMLRSAKFCFFILISLPPSNACKLVTSNNILTIFVRYQLLCFLYFRTVPGVKMKKEYREFIAENK